MSKTKSFLVAHDWICGETNRSTQHEFALPHSRYRPRDYQDGKDKKRPISA